MKEHELKEVFKHEVLENWRVKFGKVKFSGKSIGSNFKNRTFKRTILPRSIWSCKSLNLIGSSNFVVHFRELQFDVGDGTSGFEINKMYLLYSQTCPNGHLSTTASLQPSWPAWSLLTTDLFHITLCLTNTFFRSQGWPLYTGLTVFVLIHCLKLGQI